MCGRTPPQLDRCDWRSSYEPPVRGHRHYRQIRIYRIEDRWTQLSACQDQLLPRLAVIALLLLLGLLCCVVFMFVLLRPTRLGWIQVAFDTTNRCLPIVDE